MKFIDKAKIFVKSGKGGNGKVSFRREKFIPNGGPDGGDGGNGGSIIFYVDMNKETLADFSKKIHFKANNGENGGSSNCHGKSAEDLIIHIPIGTQIYDENLEVLYFDAVNLGEKFTLFEGGKGGFGNSKFVSSTNRAPKQATEGKEAKEAWVRLVLKIFCDYGFVGLPNAGKSSLLKVLTSSSTKIGNYPFTTLSPKLGTIWDSDKKLVFADLPGIIKGANKNKGLGLSFLGHIERCKGIIHVIDASLLNSLESLIIILNEIREFSEELLKKEQIILLNKIDLINEEELSNEILSIQSKFNFKIFPVSSKDKIGLDFFVDFLIKE